MSLPRCDPPVPAGRRLRHCRAAWTCGDEGIGEAVTLMRDAQRPIDPFFYDHLCRPHVGLDLIEVPVVGDSPIAPQDSLRLDAQDASQFAAHQPRSMQIGCLGRRHGEAPIVDRQIVLQERIGRVQRGDLREPQLLDHSIVKGLPEPLDSPRGLQGMGRDQFDTQFFQRAPKLTLGRGPR